MGKPFQKVHASIVGKFEDGVGEKIPQWIRANGGQFSRDVNPRITHLIATKEAFKSNAVPGILPLNTPKASKLINKIQCKMLRSSAPSRSSHTIGLKIRCCQTPAAQSLRDHIFWRTWWSPIRRKSRRRKSRRSPQRWLRRSKGIFQSVGQVSVFQSSTLLLQCRPY